MNGLVLGLDIGVASVGVGILDKKTGELSMLILGFFQRRQLIAMWSVADLGKQEDCHVARSTAENGYLIYLRNTSF